MLPETTKKVRDNKKDTLRYNLHRKIKGSTDFLLYERYTDKDTLEVIHRLTPYFKALLDVLPQYAEGDLEVTEYEVLEVL